MTMRRIGSGMWMVALSVLAGSPHAYADTPPAGSYTASCSGITFDGLTLRATCGNGMGTFFTTGLRTGGCTGDISNFKGHLYCNGGIPEGSYLGSCVNVRLYTDPPNGPVPLLKLSASCSDGRRYTATTEIYENCLTAPANVLGRLSCDQLGTGELSPPGSYHRSCADPRYFNWAETPFGLLATEVRAACRDIQGVWHEDQSVWNPEQCRTDISNVNGVLTCVP